MSTTIQTRLQSDSFSIWERFCQWITSTEHRLYIGWFGVLMIPTLMNRSSMAIISVNPVSPKASSDEIKLPQPN
jgi:photosystem II P680 reaction center D1 protein